MNPHACFSALWIISFVGGVIAVTFYAYRSMRAEKENKKQIEEQLPALAAMAQRRFEKAHGRKSTTLTSTFPELEQLKKVPIVSKE